MITPSDPSEEIDPVDLKDEVEETKISHSTESDPEIDESPDIWFSFPLVAACLSADLATPIKNTASIISLN